MRIAHLICTFPPYHSGMGQVAFEEAKRLANFGHNVTVFTLLSKDKLKPTNFKIKYLKPLIQIGNGGFCPQIIWQLKNFDIIQLHYPFFGVQETLWLGKKLKIIKAKFVVFYHMDVKLASIPLTLLKLKLQLLRPSLLKMAGKICCASLSYIQYSEIKKFYQKHSSKFIEIPFGSNQNPSAVNPDKLKKLKHQLNIGNKKILLFVGGLDKAHYFKGIKILIQAFVKLNNPDYRLIIVGAGNLRPEYENQVAKLKLQNKIIFTGCVKDEDLPYYYAACDILVLPSINPSEAFGLVLVEAKTFGKPVIASDLLGVRDAVGQSGLLCRPNNPDSLVGKIKMLLEDASLYQEFSAKTKEEIKSKYNWDEHVKKLNQVYKSI